MKIPSELILEDDRARLTPLKHEDLVHLLAICLPHPKLTQYSPYLLSSKEAVSQLINNRLSQKEAGLSFPFMVFDKKKNAYAGSTSFLNISVADSRLEIGSTFIAPEFQGSGLNSHMKKLMLYYAFEDLKMLRVELKSDARNIKSRKAIEKLGAKYEGCLRSRILLADGHRRDSVYYSILADEWPSVKANFI